MNCVTVASECDEIDHVTNIVTNCDGVVAFPTDTLYGIACSVQSRVGFERIYEIKGRSAFKPVALCFGQIGQITEYVPKCPVNLLRALLPGPVTLVIEREGSRIPDFINPTCPDYIGIRIPDDKLTQELCSSAGPLCLTSANRSGGASAITPNDFAELHANLDHVIKRGTIQKNHLSRSGSTIIKFPNLSPKEYEIIREGCALEATEKKLDSLGYRRKLEL